ncbi:PqiC family protein [Salinisphaera sp. SWV1]
MAVPPHGAKKWRNRAMNLRYRTRVGGYTTALVALGLLLGLSGCASSPPTQFIELDAQAPKAANVVHSVGIAPITMGRVSLPASLDRLALVRRTGANRLDISQAVEWGGPLDSLVRQTLGSDLAARLPRQAYTPSDQIPAGAQQGFHFLDVTCQTFSAGANNRVTLAAHWSLVDGKTHRTIIAKSATIHVQAASAGGGDIAAAMSRALALLSDQVVSALARKP